MILLCLLLFSSFLDGSSCSTLVIPYRGHGVYLTSTMDMTDLKFRQELKKDVESVTIPLNTFNESIRIVDWPGDIVEVPQPVRVMVASGNEQSYGPIENLLETEYDPEKYVHVMFYAEKLKEKVSILDTFQPSNDWEDSYWFRDTTHYVNEIIHGSVLVVLASYSPTRGYTVDYIRQKINDILNEKSVKDNPGIGFDNIHKRLRNGISLNGLVMSEKGGPKNSSLGSFSDFTKHLEVFRSSAVPIPVKLGLRPLMDFNATKEEHVIRHGVEELSPYWDLIQEMGYDVKTTYYKMTNYFRENYKNYENHKNTFLDLYKNVENLLYTFEYEFNFKKGGEQYLPSMKAYKYRAGHFYERWRELRHIMENDVEKKDKKKDVYDGTIMKIKKMLYQVTKVGDHYTANLASAITGKTTVKFDNLKSGSSSLYDVNTGEITAPISGLYLITYNLQKDSAKQTDVKIYQPGGRFRVSLTSKESGPCAKGCSQMMSGSFFVVLNKGEFLKMRMLKGNLGVNSFLSAALIREFPH